MILEVLSRQVGRWARRTLLKRPASDLHAARTFPQLWNQLIQELRPWNAVHLSLELYRKRQSVWQQTWCSRGRAAQPPEAWTLSLELQGRGGLVYEVRVALDEASRDEHHSLARLVGLLKRFLQSAMRYPLAPLEAESPQPIRVRAKALGWRVRRAA